MRSGTHLFLAAAFFLSLATLPALPQQTRAQKRAAIQAACKSGVLTPEECQSKLAALAPATADSSGGAGASRQRAAIDAACKSGTLNPAECQEKLAALDAAPAGANGASANAAGPTAASGGTNVPAAAQAIPGATTFRHPGGLYSISVPPDWQVDTSQANPKLTHGTTWAILETSASNSEPRDVAQRAASQMGGMLSGFQVTDKGDFMTLHSHPASGETATADVPTRAGSDPKTFVFWTQSDGQHHFVTLTGSMDQAVAPQTITLLMQVFNSLKFANE